MDDFFPYVIVRFIIDTTYCENVSGERQGRSKMLIAEGDVERQNPWPDLTNLRGIAVEKADLDQRLEFQVLETRIVGHMGVSYFSVFWIPIRGIL